MNIDSALPPRKRSRQSKSRKRFYYAVRSGKTPGIYETWEECKVQVVGAKGPEYKKFSTEKEAQDFIDGVEVKYPDDAVYTDGSWDYQANAAGSGVFFGTDDPRNISAPVPGEQTSPRAELWAIYLALDATSGDICICSDCKYAIKVVTKEFNATANMDMLEKIWDLMARRPGIVTFLKVKAHANLYPNEQADLLAKAAMSEVRRKNKTRRKASSFK